MLRQSDDSHIEHFFSSNDPLHFFKKKQLLVCITFRRAFVLRVLQLCCANLQVEVIAPKLVLDETEHVAYRHERLFVLLQILVEQGFSCERINEMTVHIVQGVKSSSCPFILIIFFHADQMPQSTFNANAL